MKVLLLAIGTRGDVQPFVVLGQALAERGHEVHLAAPKGFAEMATTGGITFHPLPMDFEELLKEPEIKAALTSLSGKLKAYRRANDLMNQQLSAIWELGLEIAPDLILNHFKGALAPQLARRLGGTSMPVMLQPGFMPTYDYPQFLIASRSLGRIGNMASHRLIGGVMRMGTGMMIKRWQKTTGTDIGAKMYPMGSYSPSGPAPRIHAYSPSLVPRPDTWPETEVETGYFFTEPVAYQPPSELSTFLEAGPTPIYVGFGSMPGIDHERVTKALLGALEQTGLRAVIATGWGGIEALEPGENLHVLKALPHSWLFPRVAAVVHHGGSGTTHEGLRWGRPSVIAPLFADQPFFGARVHELGAGPAPIRQKKLTADKLARALDEALSEPVKARAAALGEQIRAEDGIARAIELVESYRPRKMA